jgi:manganese transport protein
MKKILKYLNQPHSKPSPGAFKLLQYIGPGLLVTIGFIDPGNWATNFASGSAYGYSLLWVITLATLFLIVLQHNVAHLGIVTGKCLAEATASHFKPLVSRTLLSSAMLASVSTSLAEILGGAIALNMLFHIPLNAAAILITIFALIMLFTNSYHVIERWIISFLAIIGLAFIYELFLVHIPWPEAVVSWVKPTFPAGSMVMIMSVLGAVVMPHNLFLHSEIIQSRQWNLEEEKVIRRQLRFEFLDTLSSMIVGWAINSAMILLAAALFFQRRLPVQELQQAQSLLEPLLGINAAIVFAVALLFSGFASTITSGIAAGTIMAGIYDEPYNIKDAHSKLGVFISFILALLLIFMIRDPFKGLIFSQMILSIQLPITIFLQIRLTSSSKVMGQYANKPTTKYLLYSIGGIVALLNLFLVSSLFL